MAGLGYKTYVGFDEETTWGVGVAPAKFVELNSGADGLEITEERIETASVYSIHQDKDNMKQGAIAVAGDLGFDMRYEGFEKILKAAFGSVTTTQEGASINAFKHTFDIADDLTTSLSIEIGKDVSAFRAVGSMINNITFEISNTGFLVLTTGIIAKDIEKQTLATPTFPTAELIAFSEGSVKYNNSLIDVISASITLNNNLSDDRRFIGSRYIKQPKRNGKIEVTGTFTIEFENTNQYDDFRNATERALELTFTNGKVIDAANGGTWTYTFKISCPNIRLTAGLPKIDDEGVISLELPFKAYSDGSTNEIQVELQNGVSSV